MKFHHTIIFGLLFFTAISIAASDCADIEAFEKKLKEKPYIFLDFEQITRSVIFQAQDTIKGTIRTGGKGKFRIETPNQIIVSNGILEWNYSRENKQVLIDSLTRYDEYDPLTIIYDPLSVYSCQGQDNDNNKIVFHLEGIAKNTSPQELVITVKSDNYEPLFLDYVDENGSDITVNIFDFKQATNIPESDFEFDPPDGVEVIFMP